jgi:alpha/beta superfamily hydrolase
MIASSIETTSDMDYAYLLVSLPLGVYWALATTKASFFKKQPSSSNAPVFCIYGDSDQFTGVNTYEKWLKEKQRFKAIKMEGADHFWMDFEHSLVEQVDRWRNQYWK